MSWSVTAQSEKPTSSTGPSRIIQLHAERNPFGVCAQNHRQLHHPYESGGNNRASRHKVPPFPHRDTSGHEHYERLRFLAYADTDIFLIIFSVVEKPSFISAVNKVLPKKCSGMRKCTVKYQGLSSSSWGIRPILGLRPARPHSHRLRLAKN